MRKIMVATDFSERSDRALRRAVLLARAGGTGLTLLHVVDDDRPRRIVERDRADAEALLAELTATTARVDGIACTAHVRLADPFAGIVQAVADEAPDLLVIGPHRRRVLRDVFVGTTAERTIRSVVAPVLMVNAPPVGSYRRVLQTTDLSEGSRAALSRYPVLGLAPEAETSLLHVFEAPALRLARAHAAHREEPEDYLVAERTAAARALADFMAEVDSGAGAPLLRHDATTLAHEILAAAAETKADLLVVGTSDKGLLARMVLGSVAERVLGAAPVDVLALPPGTAG